MWGPPAIKTHGLLRDTTHLSAGQGLRLLIQAAYFVLVARALGPGPYGAFVTVVALAALLGPFSALGAGNLFIKNVRAARRPAALCWGNGLLLTMLSGAVLCALAVALAVLFHLQTPPLVVLVIALADLVLLKVTELAGFGFTACDRVRETSIQNVLASLLRLAGIAALTLWVHPVTLHRWALVYLLATALGSLYALGKGSRLWGRPRANLAALREDAVEGVFFSIAGSATTIYNDIDKIMLSRLAGLAPTGVYAAAYRVIDVTMTPIRSLAAAAYPRFFAKGVNGLAATYPYALSLMTATSVYGALAAAGLWLSAPLLPYILGPAYHDAVGAVRWIALIPFLRCLHSFLADALSGAGLQRARTAIQVSVAVANITLNLAVLPRFSWRGAAWTSLACDASLVVAFWVTVLYYLNQQLVLPALEPTK